MTPKDPEEHEEVFENRHHAGGEHFIQGVYVGGDPRHQAADRVSYRKKGKRAGRLQVAKDLPGGDRTSPSGRSIACNTFARNSSRKLKTSSPT